MLCAQLFANTVNQNPVLKKAGVIDAGGKGWLWALEAMLLALRGEDVTISESAPVEPPKEQADFSEFNTEDITFTYCTEFIVSRETSRDPEELRMTPELPRAPRSPNLRHRRW